MQDIIQNLEEGMKKHSSIDAAFRKEIISFLQKNCAELQIVSNKFKFDIHFFELFTQNIEKNSNEKIVDENRYYKNFNRLKKFNLIHQKSASSFTKSLSLKSINPTHTSLLVDNFQNLDLFMTQRELVLERINNRDNDSIFYLYIYLRIFALQPLEQSMLKNFSLQNIIILRDNVSVQFIESAGGPFQKSEAYNLYIFDSEISPFVQELYTNVDELMFDDIQKFEDFFLKFKKENLEKMHTTKIKYLNRNYYIFNSTPLYVTAYANLVPTVKLTLSELNKLFPDKIEKHLLEKEKKYIETVFSKNKIEEDEDDAIEVTEYFEDKISGFTIQELDELMLFMRDKSNMLNKKQIKHILKEIELYLKLDSSPHAQMFLDYVRYLLELHLAKKLRASTVRGYIWTLNKHILKNIMDLNDIQPHEIDNFNNKLHSGRYQLSSMRSIIKTVNRFFKFHAKKGLSFNTIALYYPKSMLFFDEFQKVLNEIEESERKKVARLGKHDKLMLLQKQVMVILAYYTGMRKNELRTRLLADLHIFDDELYIDVNNKGLRKQKLKLKRPSSKRRIKFSTDEASMIIIKEWYQLRTDLSKKSNYLFLKRSSTGTFLNEVIEEEIFDEFNKIIKDVTQRYCTFHSLRHSFGTNQFKDFINGSKHPYALLEHSMQMGHETPEITLKSYFHADLLRVIKMANLNQNSYL